MAFVGFDFTRMNVARNTGVTGKIQVNNKVNITSVDPADLKLKNSPQGAVKFGFKYDSDYGKLGAINLEGSVTYITTNEESKAIVSSWKKDKKLKKDLMAQLLNRILQKCNVQTILLSDAVNLPPPVPMPKVKTE